MSYGQQEIFTRDIPDRLLPTRQTSDKHPFHRWFNFVAGYSPEYVRMCFEKAGIGRNSIVLDPFAGCGTTCVEARLHGIDSVGYDRHPFLLDICRAKLSFETGLDVIEAIEEDFLSVEPQEDKVESLSESAEKYLTKLFPSDALHSLLSAREKVREYDGKKKDMGMMILSKVLEKTTHSQTDGIYKAPTSRKNPDGYVSSVREVTEEVRQDISLLTGEQDLGEYELYEASSEKMEEIGDSSCDLVVTSPPYLNNFDFAEMTRMYLYFWKYADSWGDITDKIRKHMIVNTTTALKGHTDIMELYRNEISSALRDRLDVWRDKLLKKKKNGKTKRYHYLIYPYFAQMKKVMESCHKKLKVSSRFHMVVADSALYGIHIKTEEVLADILHNIGFSEVTIKKIRSRGDRWELEKREGAEDGLGEYEISAIR